VDNDGDGYSENQGDCNDDNAAVHPAAAEIPDNGIDDDCNPATLDDDSDQDGPIEYLTQIEAEAFDAQKGVMTGSSSTGEIYVGWIENGDHIMFEGVDLGSDTSQFKARVASNTNGGEIKLRLEDKYGSDVGTCLVPYTGGWENWTVVTCSTDPVSGVKDLYLVFSGSGYGLFNVDWISFVSSSYIPATEEVPYNGVDDDHNPATLDDDLDQDGFEKADDCDDTDPGIHPNASDVCGDGIDQDCSGADLLCDDVDNDGDGFSENQGDCNDENGAIHPAAEETPYNGLDDDCNPATLDDDSDQDSPNNFYSKIEAEAFDAQQGIKTGPSSEGGFYVGWIENNDHIMFAGVSLGSEPNWFQARVASNTNGGEIKLHLGSKYGDEIGACRVPATNGWENWTTVTCSIHPVSGINDLYLVFSGSGYGLFNLDWIAFSSSSNTPAEEEEVPYNGIDDDDNPATLDDDLDQDGFLKADDCNDMDAGIYPDAAEICGDGIDQDCSGADLSCGEVDNDGDSYTESQGDCNDDNATIHPAAVEVPNNSIDDDCNPATLDDNSGQDGDIDLPKWLPVVFILLVA
jgi:hypothetical protein